MRLVTGPLVTGLLVTVLLATGCSPATPVIASTPAATSTPIPSATPRLFPETPTPVPSPIATAIPCDPLTAEYCLTEGHFLLQSPLPGVFPDVSYLYGTTQNGARDPHHGVELIAASGTPVLAAADGTVVFAGRGSDQHVYGPTLWSDRGFYGNLILLQHDIPGVPGPFFTLYGHLSLVTVQAGQSVRAGEQIGAVGVTGSAIGSHLHFEVRQGGDTYADNRNPSLWLLPTPGLAVFAGRIQDAAGQPLYLDAELQLLQLDPGGSCSLALARVPEGTTYALQAYDRRNDGRFPVGLDSDWLETFVLGNLSPGCYRLVSSGGAHERAVLLQGGWLTLVIFQVE